MNASSSCLRFSDGVKLSPNCQNRSMYSFFELHVLYALIFPTPCRALTVSHPENELETYKGITLLLSKVCYLGLSSLCSVKIEVIVMWLQKDSASTKTSVSGIFFITMLVCPGMPASACLPKVFIIPDKRHRCFSTIDVFRDVYFSSLLCR